MNDRPVEGFVAGQGPLHPKLMLVGEAPGKTEIDTHIPFSGQAGKELMQALSSTGLTREDVYITSAVRSRPYRVTHRINKRTQQTETVYPNRTPTRSGSICTRTDTGLRTDGNPAKINCDTGNIGLQRLLGKEYTVTKNHGQLYTGPVLQLTKQKRCLRMVRKNYRILPLFHPAAIFYNRSLVPVIHQDWQVLASLFTTRLKEQTRR
ncbi:uracil-DNA glycosylase [Enterococcus faecalis]|nr:uracil-DNA glycosylase [Enterococcus faecalis]